MRALKLRYPSVRRFAAERLMACEDPAIIPDLIETTRDENVDVQLLAVQALGKFAARPEVGKRLVELLAQGDICVRQQAVETLGAYQVKEAVDPLIRLLGNPFLKQRAMEALQRMGDRKGYLAVKRSKIRERIFGKKKAKGVPPPTLRKGKTGLGMKGKRSQG